MVIGLHGQAGVIAQCPVVTDNREDREHVMNQSVEEKAVTAANIAQRPVTMHVKQNVRAL